MNYCYNTLAFEQTLGLGEVDKTKNVLKVVKGVRQRLTSNYLFPLALSPRIYRWC